MIRTLSRKLLFVNFFIARALDLEYIGRIYPAGLISFYQNTILSSLCMVASGIDIKVANVVQLPKRIWNTG
jgi:hypothetical protein